jgi:hypothetical protein
LRIYHWFVEKGKVSLSLNDAEILMEIDFEDADTCLLTATDTYEISQIMTEFASYIWNNMASKPLYSKLYEVTEQGKYKWKNSDGIMQIGLDATKTFVEIDYKGKNPCTISVYQAVEMIQALENYITK